MRSSWFPRPAGEDDIFLLKPHGEWTTSRVFELLTAPDGEEWRHKVGVAGPVDGSAKATTRLLGIRHWVLKTRMDQLADSAEEILEEQEKARSSGIRSGVWHPEKTWAALHSDGKWYPLTVCRELTTLRQIAGLEERFSAWIQMIQVSLDVHRMHGLGLDLNPANFGYEEQNGRLFYLDDEFYERLSESNIANAIAARIPEEQGSNTDVWRSWGEKLRRSLSPGEFTWTAICEEIRIYPLPERYEESREGLLGALLPRARKGGGQGRKQELTCLLADVHGNLAALEAVLSEARSYHADSFLFLGDAVGYGPQPSECVRRLAELPQAVLLRGNHDHAVATGQFETGMNRLARECAGWTRAALSHADLEWLQSLQTEYAEVGWMAVHGAPQDPRKFMAYVYEMTYEDNLRYLRERKIPLCFYGHTHVQLTYAELAAGIWKLPGPQEIKLHSKCSYLVNPGSVGQPRDGDPRAAYALWNRRTGKVKTMRVTYDFERTISALHAASLPPQLEARLRSGA